MAKKPQQSTAWLGLDAEYQQRGDHNDILSYQAFLINPETGFSHRFIHHVYPNYRGKYVRLSLSDFLVKVVLSALKAGVITQYPRSIVMCGHFTRADLSMFSDFHTSLKFKLAAVQKTYVTTKRRLAFNLPFPDGQRRTTVAVVDTMLIAPDKSSLKALGDQIGLPKCEIMDGYLITEMERYRAEQPEAFDAYAIRDAEIAVRYALDFHNRLKTLGVSRLVPTVGAAGVEWFRRLFASKRDRLAFLGQDVGPECEKREGYKPDFRLAMLMSCAAGCYHGGLNQVYAIGYSPLGRCAVDVDLKGAYTTALAALSCPNWESANETKSLEKLAVIDEALTCAQVKFRFPPDAKFPCLPVRAGNNHGLLFPLEGESWCCGPELKLALDMGASITVVSGWRVDWTAGARNPFADFAWRVTDGRKAARDAGDKMLERIFKLLGASLYGKVSQGVGANRPIADDVDENRIFNTESGDMEPLPPSSITCNAIAAWITSFVRAVMSEALHRMPSTALVMQATTDGILYIGKKTDIDTSGPLAQVFKRARVIVTGELDPPVYEYKDIPDRVIVIKTRGMIPLIPPGWKGELHIAKAGVRLPKHIKTDIEIVRYAEALDRDRVHDRKFEQESLTPLSVQHRKGGDVINELKLVSLSWDFDWRNKPVEPVIDVDGVISFTTRPWRSLEEFNFYRSSFEDWKQYQHRVLKTSSDYVDFIEWISLRPTRKALRANSRGVLPNLARAIVLEALRRPRRNQRSYKEIAERMAILTGRRVIEQQIKDIRRKRDSTKRQCVFWLSAADIAFAYGFGTKADAINLMRTVLVPGSAAERQFSDLEGKFLTAPLLRIAYSQTEATLLPEEEHIPKTSPPSAPIEQESQAQPPPPQPPTPAAPLSRIEQARVDRIVRSKLADLGNACFHCRRPISAGQPWAPIHDPQSGVQSRFHRDCLSEWLEQETARARKTLGLVR